MVLLSKDGLSTSDFLGLIYGIDLLDITKVSFWIGKNLRVNAYKNGPKSRINGTSRKIDFACISSIDRS